MTECLRRLGDRNIMSYLTNMVTGWARLWLQERAQLASAGPKPW